MSSSGFADAKSFVKWLGQKAQSHPIRQIEQTLNTGKPPVKKTVAPPNPQSKIVKPKPTGPAAKMQAALSKPK